MKSLKQKIAARGFLTLKQHFTEHISNISGLRRGDTWLRRQMVGSCNWDTDSYSCASSCVLPVWGVLVLLQEGLKQIICNMRRCLVILTLVNCTGHRVGSIIKHRELLGSRVKVLYIFQYWIKPKNELNKLWQC